MKCVILETELNDFYKGSTYIFQGCRYAAVGKKSEAKIYSSKKRAENAAESLNNKCDGRFEVLEVKEDVR